MQVPKTVVRRASAVTIAILGAGVFILQLGGTAGADEGSAFRQTNLVSDLAGVARVTDPNLKNPWGLSSAPTSPLWVSDNNAGVTTVYKGDGSPFDFAPNMPLIVNIPAPGGVPGGAPTGTVFNPTTDFAVSLNGVSAASRFIFATEDGTIVGWSPSVDFKNGVIAVDNSAVTDSAGDVGAVYKGLTSGSVGTDNFLYATNFRFGTVDVFDGAFHQLTWKDAFTDDQIPGGYAPFGIQNLRGRIYVTYAVQNAQKHDDLKGPGHGFVDVFSTGGKLLRRLIRHAELNSPWGLAIAPDEWGGVGEDLLVGNFGDGRINAYDGGEFDGALSDAQGAPISIEGLWGLRFGNGSQGASVNALYFAAGINDEADGLLGTITPLQRQDD
jgi:uncharacterized protein (TIGR03118 family)